MLLHQICIQAKKNTKKHSQQSNAASDTSNTLKFQNANPSRSTPQPQSNQIFRHFTCMRGPITYWKSIGLKVRMQNKITHTQRHINNAWNEMVLYFPCFAFITFLLLLGSHKQYGVTFIPLRPTMLA
jgi:hypothetical protein